MHMYIHIHMYLESQPEESQESFSAAQGLPHSSMQALSPSHVFSQAMYLKCASADTQGFRAPLQGFGVGIGLL